MSTLDQLLAQDLIIWVAVSLIVFLLFITILVIVNEYSRGADLRRPAPPRPRGKFFSKLFGFLGKPFRSRQDGDPDPRTADVAGGSRGSPFNYKEVKKDIKALQNTVADLDKRLRDLSDELAKRAGAYQTDYLSEVIFEALRRDPDKFRKVLEGGRANIRPASEPRYSSPTSPPIDRVSSYSRGDKPSATAALSHRGGRDAAAPTQYLELRDLYNASLRDHARRAEFKEKYKPLVISVVNAVERRRDEHLPPVYQTSTDGNFQAVRLDSRGAYAVFPNFGISLEASSYYEGAIGEVFQCGDFDGRHNYPNISVEAPAIFVSKGNDGWELETPGVLNLGHAQEP